MATRNRKRPAQGSTPGNTVVQGPLTIYTVATWKEQLLAALAGCEALELDLSAATEIDGAGLQLLIAAKHEATRQGKPLRIVGHTPWLLDALDLCRLVGFFGDPLVIPSQID